MIIETNKIKPGRRPFNRPRLISVLVLSVLAIGSTAIGIISREVVFVAFTVFSFMCGVAVLILIGYSRFSGIFAKRFYIGLITLTCLVPAIFVVSWLRSGYTGQLLRKEGRETYGTVVDVFREYGRRGSHKMKARLVFRAGDKTLSKKVSNPDQYLNINDTVLIRYAATDPDLFVIRKLKKWHPGYAHQDYQQMPADLPAGRKIAETPGMRAPQFRGGQQGFADYLRNNLVYPEEAQKNRTTGKVFLSFVIQEDGSIADVRVVKGLGDGCDEAAVKAVRNSPPWLPGLMSGKAVRVKYNLPVSFSLP